MCLLTSVYRENFTWLYECASVGWVEAGLRGNVCNCFVVTACFMVCFTVLFFCLSVQYG